MFKSIINKGNKASVQNVNQFNINFKISSLKKQLEQLEEQKKVIKSELKTLGSIRKSYLYLFKNC